MKKIFLDDMILTKDLPTTAGSRMLDGYMSLFDATVAEKLVAAGYTVEGKLPVGEFAIDLVGETCYAGDASRAADTLKTADAAGLVCFDVNGAPRRVAAQSGLVCIKPTYGTVSRFGTVPVACSGECVSVTATTPDACREILCAMEGKDERDGTMHADDVCKKAGSVCEKSIKRIAVLGFETDAEVAALMESAKSALAASGIELTCVDAGVIADANAAWNMLMCAELCNNVSRYDGIKYGYRTKNYKSLDELYTNSRTEAFGLLLKTAILYGSDVLSTKSYMAKYDKAMRVRRVVCEAFAKLFETYDAVLLPAVSKMAYTAADSAFEENRFTAPATLAGLPAVVAGGVQLIAPAFGDAALLDVAKILVKEGN